MANLSHRELLVSMAACAHKDKDQETENLIAFVVENMKDLMEMSFKPVDLSEWSFLENVALVPKSILQEHNVYVFATCENELGEWPKPMYEHGLIVFTQEDYIINMPTDWQERVVKALERSGKEVVNG